MGQSPLNECNTCVCYLQFTIRGVTVVTGALPGGRPGLEWLS